MTEATAEKKHDVTVMPEEKPSVATRRGLTAEEILSAKDTELVEVPVPEWGGVVFLKPLTNGERSAWENALNVGDAAFRKNKGEGFSNSTLRMKESLLVIAICDENGKQVFDEHQIGALSKKNSGVIDRLYLIIQRLNALTEKDLEDIAKNYGRGAKIGSSAA